MNILVFEYVTGGGFAGKPLPQSLAAEGRLMVQALLNELSELPDIRFTVLQDARCCLTLPDNACAITVPENQEMFAFIAGLLPQYDAFWPVAPETGGILKRLAQLAENSGTRLLSPTSHAVHVCSDKLQTYRVLQRAGISAVMTVPLSRNWQSLGEQAVIKARDGVGCEQSWRISSDAQYRSVTESLEVERYVMQPYVAGTALSLSCLFKGRRGWLLCCNQQQIQLTAAGFQLDGCLVNVETTDAQQLQRLVEQVASAISGLWGYVGIDLILRENGDIEVLEINPRLTTSYCGILAATRINVAEQMLNLLRGFPSFQRQQAHTVAVAIG